MGVKLLILDLAPPPVKNQVYAPDCNFNIFPAFISKITLFFLGRRKNQEGTLGYSVVLSSLAIR